MEKKTEETDRIVFIFKNMKDLDTLPMFYRQRVEITESPVAGECACDSATFDYIVENYDIAVVK
ncbi:hypothetical protein DRJ25_05345 [Candidatus Woesearchaeota archaeon]|nr:MAG: hypothetical protein DRJ25_05345 [Candidatus Woesearchaeota archaeon]